MLPPTPNVQHAIQLLQEMGLSREQATKSLEKHHYNVNRAADAHFSGDANNNASGSKPARVNTTRTKNADSPDGSWCDSFDQVGCMPQTWSTIQGPEIATWNSGKTEMTLPDPGLKSAVAPPSPSPPSPTVSWMDSDDPLMRVAAKDMCIGLAPVHYCLPYLPAFVQALFHIPVIQQAIFSFRPTSSDWGVPKYYWCGEGDQIPSNSEIVSPPSASPRTSMLIGLEDNNPPSAVNTSGSDQRDKFPKSSLALCELQRLFAFLSLSTRAYGSAKQLMQALEREEIAYSTVDNNVDDFLEKMLLYLVKMEDYRDGSEKHLMPLRSLFPSVTHNVLDDNMTSRDIHHFTVEINGLYNTFHAVLARLGCCQGLLDDADVTCDAMDDDTQYKQFMTFETLPRILIATIHHALGANDSPCFHLDKTVYLDRYLTDNKNELLKRCAQAQRWKKEIRTIQATVSRMEIISVGSSDNKHIFHRCDIMRLAISYFEHERPSTDPSVKALKTMLNTVEADMNNRRADFMRQIETLQHRIAATFNDNEFKKTPYDLQSIVYRDNGSLDDRYWAHVRVDLDNSRGQWYRFSDFDVSEATESDVLSAKTCPFAVIYVDRSVPKVSQSDRKESIPENLKEFIKMDNEDFAEEIRVCAALKVSNDGHCDSSETTPEDIEPNPILTPAEPLSPQPTIHEGIPSESVIMEFNVLMAAGTEFTAYDPKILRGFEYFLAALQSADTLKAFLSTYTMEMHGITKTIIIREQESRYDPSLSPLWRQYDAYSNIAKTMTEALLHFSQKRYSDALTKILQVKQQEEEWKVWLEHTESSPIGDTYPMLYFLGFNILLSKYGKACLKVLDNDAYDMIVEPIYRNQGLCNAIDIARKAQILVGVNRLEKDRTYIRMRQQWLNFSFSSTPIRTALGPQQDELLSMLITTYLDTDGAGQIFSSPYMAPPSPIAADPSTNADQPLWERYRNALSTAAAHLCNLKKGWAEAAERLVAGEQH